MFWEKEALFREIVTVIFQGIIETRKSYLPSPIERTLSC